MICSFQKAAMDWVHSSGFGKTYTKERCIKCANITVEEMATVQRHLLQHQPLFMPSIVKAPNDAPCQPLLSWTRRKSSSSSFLEAQRLQHIGLVR